MRRDTLHTIRPSSDALLLLVFHPSILFACPVALVELLTRRAVTAFCDDILSVAFDAPQHLKRGSSRSLPLTSSVLGSCNRFLVERVVVTVLLVNTRGMLREKLP